MQTNTQTNAAHGNTVTNPNAGNYWAGLNPVGTWVHMVTLTNGRCLVCHGITYNTQGNAVAYRVNSVSGQTVINLPASMVSSHYLGYNNPGHSLHGSCKLALGTMAYGL